MIRKITSIIAILAIILAVPAFSRAAGSADTVTSATQPKTDTTAQTDTRISAFSADQPYTLEEMLTYAIQDEYAAQSLYSNAIINYGAAEPFKRLLQEENGLIDLLTLLLTDYGVALPDLTEVREKQAIASLREACLAGIKAEIISIEMYNAFLAKDNLPDGVADVFQLLLDVSQSHLDALKTKASEEGWIQITQNKVDRDDGDDESEYEDHDDEDDD